jgi:hypothetical protein
MELSGMIWPRTCKKKMIDKRVVISKAIFSPLSGGKAKPRTLIQEMKIYGNTKLNRK